MAGLGVSTYLVRRAGDCGSRLDAKAPAHIYIRLGVYDIDLGGGLLHQGRTALARAINPIDAKARP
jgi:hypothetical protein